MKLSFKRKKNKKIYSWLVILILAIICFFLIKNVFNLYLSERKTKLNRIQSESVFNNLEEKNNQIVLEIEYLKTEKGIETELRDKFRVVKEGEQLAVIINSKNKNTDFLENKKENIWDKFLNLFRN